MKEIQLIPVEKFVEHHSGMHYQNVLEQLCEKRHVNNYLEVGVQQGILFSKIKAKEAHAVDPSFAINVNVASRKDTVVLHQKTSDSFFAEWSGPSDGNPLDFAFLDGFHTFEFLLRDFYNTEKFSGARTLIGMHDCLPVTEAMADRDEKEAIARGIDTAYPSAWTGDVWKIIPILKRYRPDVTIVCIDAHPTGIVFVTDLDPENNVLEKNYMKIIHDFSALPNNLEEIKRMYSTIDLLPAQTILKNLDYSLYFRS